METFFITLAVIFVPVLVFLIYILINAERYSAAAESGCMCPYPDACQDYSEATNPPSLKTESFESGRSHLSPYPNACQDCSEVPKPPPVTDPHIVDYYYNYYCHYYNLHYLTIGQPDSEALKPPLVTDPCIVYYYYYYYSYYFHYHKAKGTSRSRHPRHKKKRRAFSSRIPSPVRPTASHLTAAATSHASARGTQQMNIGRPRASILKSVYMTSWASRIPRPINRDRLHCRSRPKKVTFGEIRVIRFYK